MAASLSEVVGEVVPDAPILLVDDQPARLMTYEAILAPLGERLVAVQSGEDALRRLMEGEFAVILLDVSMPGLDGFETAQLIHAHPRFENTPIIFVTGVHVDELDRLQGYRLGAIDYVQIPLVPDILRSKVAVLVELYRKRRQLRALNDSLAGENADLVSANLALQTERAREYQALSETLADANARLSTANQALETEVAERRRAELVSMELAASLRRLDQRKDEFIATLAHELRNPLAAIRSAVGLLHGGGDAAGRARAVQVLDRQLEQLVRLVDDLLDASRMTYDRIDLRRERCELSAVLSAASDGILPAIEARGQSLLRRVAGGPHWLYGDPKRLAQVLGNLLSNASKYTPPGGTIEVVVEAADGMVSVTVADDGIGIAEADLATIFEPFVQTDAAREHAPGGLGIGLSLVKRLVELHGGRVAAESPGEGAGARFTVWLPVDLREAPAAAAEEVAAFPPRVRRIVVIDDNRDAADMLALSLDMLGHEACCVYDPREALDAIAEFGPEIAFVDLGMPGIDGIELAAMIRERHGGALRLVALTGWGQPADRERTRAAGFDDHVVKPISLADVERICAEG